MVGQAEGWELASGQDTLTRSLGSWSSHTNDAVHVSSMQNIGRDWGTGCPRLFASGIPEEETNCKK
jgi:hypothetical protein